MKYRDLIQFEPVSTVIQLRSTDDKVMAKDLVRTYVAAPSMETKFEKQIVKHLQFERPEDNKALMIIGNYGTGKSHLMSVISAIAEDATEVDNLKSDKLKSIVKPISGKFKVVRVEIGAVSTPLAEIIGRETIEPQFKEWGIDYTYPDTVRKSHKDEVLEPMMQAFSEKFPNQGLLIVIDELLDFLRAKNEQEQVSDLGFIRELGEFCEFSKFRLITGMQESLFDNPKFMFINDSINRIKQRTEIVQIDKTDIQFVVTERLLKKTSDQKAAIRNYLEPFKKYYNSLSTDFDNFVDLFPVHPDFLAAFSRMIMVEKREVLKTISTELSELLDKDVPAELDLLTIDKYWKRVNASFNIYEGVREVSSCNNVLIQKINSGIKLPGYKNMAIRIVNALSVQRLENADINFKLGLTAQELRDNLCLYDPAIDEMGGDEPDKDLLTEIESVLKMIMKAANGQYISQANDQYYIDVHKTVDFDQQIAAKIDALSPDKLDSYFFALLVSLLECGGNTYEFTGHLIWSYELRWLSRKSFKRGWLFFGNPDERSTAVPQKDFYLYFLPPFTPVKYQKKETDDEMVFSFSDYDSDFEVDLKHYAAATELALSSSQQIKQAYQSKADEYAKKADQWMRKKVLECFSINYKGSKKNVQEWIKGINLRDKAGIGSNDTLNFRDTINTVSSSLFEKYFEDQAPEYPVFATNITSQNINKMTSDVIRYLASSSGTQTTAVSSILNSLGLLDNGKLNPRSSKYTKSILSKLEAKPEGVVLKRDELIAVSYDPTSDEFYSDSNYRLEPQFVAILLVALVRSGDIILSYKGIKYDASNLRNLASEMPDNLAHFDRIERPKDYIPAVIKALFELVDLPVESNYQKIKDGNDEAVRDLMTKLNEKISNLAKDAYTLKDGVKLWGSRNLCDIDLSSFINFLKSKLEYLRGYDSCGKLKNIKYSKDDIASMKEELLKEEDIKAQYDKVSELNAYESWFKSAANVLPHDNHWNNEYQLLQNEIDSSLSSLSNDKISSLKQTMDKLKKSYCKEYSEYHQKSHLGQNESSKLSEILQSDDVILLGKLKRVVISSSQLDGIIKQIMDIKPCKGFSDAELMQNPICPNCNYVPSREGVHDVRYEITQLDSKIADLKTQWIQSLKDDMEDPSLESDIKLLDPDKQKLINDFKATGTIPDNIDDFVEAMAQVRQGMVKKSISIDEIKDQLMENGKPLTVEQLKSNFDKLLASLCRNESKDKIRIVLE